MKPSRHSAGGVTSAAAEGSKDAWIADASGRQRSAAVLPLSVPGCCSSCVSVKKRSVCRKPGVAGGLGGDGGRKGGGGGGGDA